MSKGVYHKKDWHKADIKAALEKIGYSFNRIAKENGYHRSYPHQVLARPAPRIEKIVADLLGTTPQKIWPSRYEH